MSLDLIGELTRDLESAARGIADSAMIDRGANWIEQLRVEFPLAHNFINSVLHQSPRKVLIALATLDYRLAGLIENEYALKYVAKIQEALRDKGRADRATNRIPG